jgi:hypothetical protein
MGDWTYVHWLVFSVPLLLILLSVAVYFLFLRGTIRTRYVVGQKFRDDPDINEWIVCFNWSRKVLYVPAIIASFAAGLLTVIFRPEAGEGLAEWIGGIWLAVFFLNFLVDEYEVSLKLIVIIVLLVVVLVLWLTYLNWLGAFFRLFTRVDVGLNAAAYFAFGVIMSVAVVVSWVRGLFYYVAVTPNYLNIQVGPTETGEQLGREEYSTRIDTGDFLERLQGFGRLIITFADHRRPPMVLLVGRIGRVASRLESIRGKLAVDRHQEHREGMGTE